MLVFLGLSCGGGGGGGGGDSAPVGDSTDLLVDVPSEVNLSQDNYLTVQVQSSGGTINYVVADLSNIGGDQNQNLNDDGIGGDVIAGDGIWSYVAPILWVPENSIPVEIRASFTNGQSVNITKHIPVTQFIQFQESDQENLGNPATPVEGWFNIENIDPAWVLDPSQHLSYSRIIHGREVTVVFDDDFDLGGVAGYNEEMTAEWCFKTFETFWNIFGGYPYLRYQVNFLHDATPRGGGYCNAMIITDGIHNPMDMHEMFHAYADMSYTEYGYVMEAPPGYLGDRRIKWVTEASCHYNALRIAPKMGGGDTNTYFFILNNFLYGSYPDVPLSEIESWQVELGLFGTTPHDKGCAVYYLLDKMIVTLTNGLKNIDNLWRYFYLHYGVNLDHPDQPDPNESEVNPLNQPLLNFRKGDFLSALKEVTDHQFDTEFEEFWTRYVDGTESLPSVPIYYINHKLAAQ